MNAFDRFLSAVAPGVALQREIARRDLKTVQSFSFGSSYSSGNTTSRKRASAAFGRSQMSTEEESTGCYGYDAMRLEAMDLYRNNPIARGIVETSRRYCRQSKPRANTAGYLQARGATESQVNQAESWDLQATDYFCGEFWSRADALRRPGMTFGAMQEIEITNQFLQGDMAFVRTPAGWLMVEGLQIRTPSQLRGKSNIRHGFRFNSKGQPTHIYICKYGKGGYVDDKDFRRVPMSSVVFCPWFFRPAQFRGVPRLHGVIDSLRDQEETHDATKQKVKNEAMLLSIERAGSRKKAPGSTLSMDDGTKVITESATYGMRFKTSGKPGEDFMFAKGDSPNAQYVDFMEYDARIISAGSGIPYKVLMAMYDGSWSSNKAAQTAMKVFVNDLWQNRRTVMTQRIYNAEIAQAIRDGILPPAPTDSRGMTLFSKADWSRPYFPQLDQEKEEKGRRSAFVNMTASLDDFADEQGTTTEDLLQTRKKNIQQMQRDADELGMTLEQYAPEYFGKNAPEPLPEGGTTNEI